MQLKLRCQRRAECRKNAIYLAEGARLGVVVGGVGLSEFEDVIKHSFPQGFVRMVTKKIGARGMQI